MMSLASISLTLEHPGNDQSLKIENFIERYISTSSYLPWLRPSNPPPNSPGLTFPWPRPERKTRLFRLVWPQGASRWAYGHYLASSDQVSQIMQSAYDGEGQYSAIPLVISTPEIAKQVGQPDASDNTVTIAVYLLPPTPLSGIRGLTGQTQSLYLISVVDVRYFWYQNSTGDLSMDSTTSWNDMYRLLSQKLGLSEDQFKWDTVDVPYLFPSPGMFSPSYQPITFMLDAVAMNVGHRIIANYDGTFAARGAFSETRRLGEDFTKNAATRIVMAGGTRFADVL